MLRSLTTLKLQAVVAASLVLAQVASAALISENFQTDPFATPNPRWLATGTPVDVQWDSTAKNLKIGQSIIDMVSAADVVLPTTNQTAYLQYDFNPGNMSGSLAQATVMRQSNGAGYIVAPYIVEGPTSWYLGTLVPDSSTTCSLLPGTWYTVRVEMIDDTVNNQTLLTGSLLQGNTVLAGFVAHDSSAGRYKTHQGFSVAVYPGDNYHGINNNPYLLDNIEAGAVPEPASFGLLAGLAALGLARRRAR